MLDFFVEPIALGFLNAGSNLLAALNVLVYMTGHNFLSTMRCLVDSAMATLVDAAVTALVESAIELVVRVHLLLEPVVSMPVMAVSP